MKRILTGIAKEDNGHGFFPGHRYFFTRQEPERDSWTGEYRDRDIWEAVNMHRETKFFAGEGYLDKLFKDIE